MSKKKQTKPLPAPPQGSMCSGDIPEQAGKETYVDYQPVPSPPPSGKRIHPRRKTPPVPEGEEVPDRTPSPPIELE
jgi:hypothetical protein